MLGTASGILKVQRTLASKCNFHPILFALLILFPVSKVWPQSGVPVAPATSVVVTATFEPVPLNQANRSVFLLDTSQAPLLFDSVSSYLRLDPSIDMQARAPGGVQTDLTIRGATFEQSLVLVNGLRLNDAQSGHHDMDLPLPLEALSRIEVLHGAGSTFYGSDAIGGAVNLITSAPAQTEAMVSTGAGNDGVNQQMFIGSAAFNRASMRLAASRDFSSGFTYDRDYRSEAAAPEFWLKTPLGQTDVLLAGSDRAFGADDFYGNYPSWERTKGWFSSVQQPFGKWASASLAYRRHSDEFVLVRDDPSLYENNHMDQSWQGIVRGSTDLHPNTTLAYGVEEDADQIASNNLGHHGRNSGAGYVNLDARALGHFSLSAGAREQLFSGGDAVFAPSLSAGVWLKGGWRLRGSVSRGYRLGTYTDLYYSDPATLGNPNLKPESAWDEEGGAEWHPGGRVQADVTVFHAHEHNDIDYVKLAPVTPAELWQAENIPTFNRTGAEASVRIRLGANQELDFGYMGIHGSGLSPDYAYEYVASYPSNNANVAWSAVFARQIQARSKLQIVQRYRQTAYPLWDAGVARSTGRLRPYLNFENISNTGYQEISGVAMPGHTVVGGMELVFSHR